MLNRLLEITSSSGFGNKDGVLDQSVGKMTSSLFCTVAPS